MIELNVKKEWEVLKYELFENKPNEIPFPERIVRKRELLLLAQNLLTDYEFTKTECERFIYGFVYKETMKEYFEYN